MAFDEDLSAFFNTDDFAVTATWNSRSVRGIFEDQYVESSLGLAGMATSGPRFTCAAADVSGIAVGNTFTVNSVAYTAAELQPDGTGLITIVLKAPT